MHDDQHGTAIISAAALKNAIDITEKDISKVKIVVNGAGAAAISCTRLYLKLGVKRENVVMCDSKGVIRKDRASLTSQKAEFATDRDLQTLDEAMHHADIFIGLSKGNIVTPAMLLSMEKNPIVFAMANPIPEIEYDIAVATRNDIIMATGRSDHPNQVNNVLGFPFIFRGALDVRATKINEEMKMAAVHALADLAKKSVPEQVNIVYDEVNLAYGREYIIPKPFDPRLIYEIPPAIAKAAMDSGVALEPIEDWDKYREELMERSGSGSKEIRLLHNRAKSNPKRVVFAEADHLDVLKAAQRVHEEKLANVILLGRKELILELKEEIGFTDDVTIIDPKTDEEKERRGRFGEAYWKKRQRKGRTFSEAKKLMRERNYFAAMMVNEEEADALITGYSRPYPTVVKPMLELIERDKDVSKIAACNLMLTKQGPLFLADTTINENPTAKELAKIVQMTGKFVNMFGMKPNIAMLSYSNFGSSNSETSKKIREAVSYIHRYFPDTVIDGEIQADFALNREMLAKEFPFSKLNGKKVNVLIFPNLESANITYKLLKQVEGAESIGPVILGFNKPVHIIQLGASVDEMVNMAALAVVDAQQKEKRKRKA
jgi:malate dehydrogenase (oxaloacetate-decarboxylating)(NADP+)